MVTPTNKSDNDKFNIRTIKELNGFFPFVLKIAMI